MNSEEFKKYGYQLVDWMSEYLNEKVVDYPVKSQAQPRQIYNQIPDNPPLNGEPFENLFRDFTNIIMPGITHWNSPNFFAYFPCNNSYISILAEMLIVTLGSQCMMWDTSPAAAELEEKVVNWLKDMCGLPKEFAGCIQDTASTCTLISLITAREKVTNYSVNQSGYINQPVFRVYQSTETHSSIEKAVKVMGVGKENLRKIPVDDQFRMIPEELEKAILEDKESGYIPLAVVGAMGTTGSTSCDPLRTIGEICKKYNIWFHVDGALSGSALILPEKSWMSDGLEYADTYVFNPHKWLFTNFDCSAYFVKDTEALVKTFEILPEYLKSKTRGVNNYRDWGIALGRRFRALKLWWVIRNFGVNGLQEKLRTHISLAAKISQFITESDDFELLAPVPLNTVCFRFHPKGIDQEEKLDQINDKLLQTINSTGKCYFSHTKLKGKYTIRFMIGQTQTEESHVTDAWNLIIKTSQELCDLEE